MTALRPTMMAAATICTNRASGAKPGNKQMTASGSRSRSEMSSGCGGRIKHRLAPFRTHSIRPAKLSGACGSSSDLVTSMCLPRLPVSEAPPQAGRRFRLQDMPNPRLFARQCAARSRSRGAPPAWGPAAAWSPLTCCGCGELRARRRDRGCRTPLLGPAG
jgi:hypothetical protein